MSFSIKKDGLAFLFIISATFITFSPTLFNDEVYLTNDSVDGIASVTETNGIVTLTSFGYGPDNSRAITQVTAVQGGGIPRLPGAITMPGPHVSYNGGTSNASTYIGDATHPAISVNSSAGRTEVST